MLTASHNGRWVVRFTDGEAFMEGLQALPLDAAFLVAGVGMLRDVRLAYWTGERYETTALEEPVELLSLQGNIGRSDERRIVHCHVTVGRRDTTTRGGHLVSATVHNTVELFARETPGIALDRKEEPTGLVGLYPRAT
jgi:predicted DNA-binding protein with PD1-like motif